MIALDINVDKVFRTLLETQKGDVREDRENYSVAMVVIFTRGKGSQVAFPKFWDETSKTEAYAELVTSAKRDEASLIITVNDAYGGGRVSADALAKYKWGDWNSSNSDRCILLTASGPGLKSYGAEVTYTLVDDDVIFSEMVPLTTLEINLLPDWPGVEPSNARPS